jgi:hypothetical protein
MRKIPEKSVLTYRVIWNGFKGYHNMQWRFMNVTAKVAGQKDTDSPHINNHTNN